MNKTSLQKRLLAVALSVLTTFSVGAVAMTTTANLSPTVYALDLGDDVTDWDKKMLKAESKLIFGALNFGFAPVFPGIEKVTGVLEQLLGASGVLDIKETTLDDVNDNLNQLRKDIETKLEKISSQISQTGEYVLDQISNKLYVNGLGHELDSLHTTASGMAAQIKSIRNSSSLTEKEKLVEIAALIDSNKEWYKEGHFVFRIWNISNTLSGQTFSDLNNRDLYQVLYDTYLPQCLFTSEIYDKAAPYVERVMYEFFYGYSIMAECMKAAMDVAKFSNADVAALSQKQKNQYTNIVSVKDVVEDEIMRESERILNIHDENSIFARYSNFLYNAQNSRLNYVDKGNVLVGLSQRVGNYEIPIVDDHGEVCTGHATSTTSAAHQAFDSAKATFQTILNAHQDVPSSKMAEMAAYIQANYPNTTSVWNYLSDRGFTFETKDSNTNMLVSDASVQEKKLDNGERYGGYKGWVYNKENLSPEDVNMYTVNLREERDKWCYQYVAYNKYYSSRTPDAIKSKPVLFHYLEKGTLVNDTKVSLMLSDENTDSLHIECCSTGATGAQKQVIRYRKKGDTEWTNIYLTDAVLPFDKGTISEYEFVTEVTDSTGATDEFRFTYVPGVEPYIDSNGEYIPGVASYFEIGDKKYVAKADGSVGEEFEGSTAPSLSYFDFELLSNDTYQIKCYKGLYSSLTDLVIPKTFNGKKITVLGSDDGGFIRAIGSKKQFTLVLNENITEIKQYAFYTTWVKKVTGNTSGLRTIGKYAFSWTNSIDGFAVDFQLDYPGEVVIGYGAFNNIKATIYLRHDTSLNLNANNMAVSIDYVYTDNLKNTSAISANSVTLGNAVKVKCAAEDGTAPYQYQVLYKKVAGSKWTVAQDFKDNAVVSFKPAAAAAYDICVKVKDADGTVEEKYFTVKVTTPPVNSSTLSATTIKLGDKVTVTGKATGGSGTYTYGVYYKKASSETWSTAQSYSKNTSVSIKPATATTYDICVKVKDSDGSIEKKYFTVNVTAPLANNSTISATTVKLGDKVTVTGKATGGTAPYQYNVLYKKTTGSKWTVVQEYKNNAVVSFRPAAAATYDVCVKVKDTNGSIEKKYFTVNVTAPLANNSTLSAATVKLGDKVTVTGKATGGTAPYQYNVLYKKTTGSKWTVAQEYKDNAAVSFKPAAATTYDICVKVKDSSGTIVKKYFTVTVSA